MSVVYIGEVEKKGVPSSDEISTFLSQDTV